MPPLATPEWWRRHWRNGRIFLTAVSLIFGTVIAVEGGWPTVEPAVPAHRGYVREHTESVVAKSRTDLRNHAEPTRVGMLELQISFAKGRQAQIKNSLLSLEILMAKAADTEEKIRTQFQIRELQAEYLELDTDIKRYRLDRDKQ